MHILYIYIYIERDIVHSSRLFTIVRYCSLLFTIGDIYEPPISGLHKVGFSKGGFAIYVLLLYYYC